MLAAAVRTLVKNFVELVAAVAASDFDYDFLFHYFLPRKLLLPSERLLALKHASSRSKYSYGQRDND